MYMYAHHAECMAGWTCKLSSAALACLVLCIHVRTCESAVSFAWQLLPAKVLLIAMPLTALLLLPHHSFLAAYYDQL